jgi:hypothetical protein
MSFNQSKVLSRNLGLVNLDKFDSINQLILISLSVIPLSGAYYTNFVQRCSCQHKNKHFTFYKTKANKKKLQIIYLTVQNDGVWKEEKMFSL